jgi:hypothetical protein
MYAKIIPLILFLKNSVRNFTEFFPNFFKLLHLVDHSGRSLGTMSLHVITDC